MIKPLENHIRRSFHQLQYPNHQQSVQFDVSSELSTTTSISRCLGICLGSYGSPPYLQRSLSLHRTVILYNLRIELLLLLRVIKRLFPTFFSFTLRLLAKEVYFFIAKNTRNRELFDKTFNRRSESIKTMPFK